MPDSTLTQLMLTSLSHSLSGVFDVAGEYIGPSGALYRASGYWAFVASSRKGDATSDRAVLALNVRSFDGKTTEWLAGTLQCRTPTFYETTTCIAEAGSPELLDLNFVFKTIVTSDSLDLREPEVKAHPGRFAGRFTPRGTLTLTRR